MKVKAELMEYLVRHCVQEVLSQAYEGETKGASAPPADGQGTADTPAIPKKKDTRPQDPSGKQTTPMSSLRGVVLVDPRDKSKLQPVTFQKTDDASIKQTLTRLAQSISPSVGVSNLALPSVSSALLNTDSTVYLYVGKEPNSGKSFLMADKNLNIAKDEAPTYEETAVNEEMISLIKQIVDKKLNNI